MQKQAQPLLLRLVALNPQSGCSFLMDAPRSSCAFWNPQSDQKWYQKMWVIQLPTVAFVTVSACSFVWELSTTGVCVPSESCKNLSQLRGGKECCFFETVRKSTWPKNRFWYQLLIPVLQGLFILWFFLASLLQRLLWFPNQRTSDMAKVERPSLLVGQWWSHWKSNFKKKRNKTSCFTQAIKHKHHSSPICPAQRIHFLPALQVAQLVEVAWGDFWEHLGPFP